MNPAPQPVLSLRRWLNRAGREVDRLESLFLFAQVVDMVAAAHTQGHVVSHVRPACFVLSAHRRVVYHPPFLRARAGESGEGEAGEAGEGEGEMGERGGGGQVRLQREEQQQQQEEGWRQQEEGGAGGGAAEGTATWREQQAEAWQRAMLQEQDEEGMVAQGQGQVGQGRLAQGQEGGRAQRTAAGRGMAGQQRLNPSARGAEAGEQGGGDMQWGGGGGGGGGGAGGEGGRAEEEEARWYTSPEEARGDPVGAASDVFKLGVLFFEVSLLLSEVRSSQLLADIASMFAHRGQQAGLEAQEGECDVLLTFLSRIHSQALSCSVFHTCSSHLFPLLTPAGREVRSSQLLADVASMFAHRGQQAGLEAQEAECDVLLAFLVTLSQHCLVPAAPPVVFPLNPCREVRSSQLLADVASMFAHRGQQAGLEAQEAECDVLLAFLVTLSQHCLVPAAPPVVFPLNPCREVRSSQLLADVASMFAHRGQQAGLEAQEAECDVLLAFLVTLSQHCLVPAAPPVVFPLNPCREVRSSQLLAEVASMFAHRGQQAGLEAQEAECDVLLAFLVTLSQHCLVPAAPPVVFPLNPCREVRSSQLLAEVASMFAHRGQQAGLEAQEAECDVLLAFLSIHSKCQGQQAGLEAQEAECDVLLAFLSRIHLAKQSAAQKLALDLGRLTGDIHEFARYSRFEVRATLRHAHLLSAASMVCSLAFDRDAQFFATGGVCRRIRIFECESVLAGRRVDVHYPVVEMGCRAKLSCVSWNGYIKNRLASADYDGVVQLWDAGTGAAVMEWGEHEKRAWSVDFSPCDPTRLASGSDDGTVKLWSINQDTSVGTIHTKANVCSVAFPPHSSHLLALGSADYSLHCFDLRSLRAPLATLTGHSKAVSYVKFVDASTIVSASTDNTLKLWDLNHACSQQAGGGVDGASACTRTFTGHTNEKNFVGLTVADGYIACGSETNE
ncbi:unnamed protein product, partial [Closterium sp. Yama58-4]